MPGAHSCFPIVSINDRRKVIANFGDRNAARSAVPMTAHLSSTRTARVTVRFTPVPALFSAARSSGSKPHDRNGRNVAQVMKTKYPEEDKGSA